MHPAGDLEEEGVVIAAEIADSVFPLGFSHASDFVDTRFYIPGIVEMELIFVIGHGDFIVCTHFCTLCNSQNHIEI